MAEECPFRSSVKAGNEGRRLAKQIREQAKTSKVDTEVAQLRKLAKDCNISLGVLGLNFVQLDMLVVRGQKAATDSAIQAKAKADRRAQNCRPVRLDQRGGSMESMPVLDQADSGTCYAYTAAQMIDAWRFSKGDMNKSDLSSPLAIAAATKYFESLARPEMVGRSEGNRILDGAPLSSALNAGLRFGSCSSRTTKEGRYEEKIQRKIDRLLDAYRQYRSSPGSSTQREEISQGIVCEFNGRGSNTERFQRLRDQIVGSFEKDNAYDYLYSLLDTFCSPPERLDIPGKPRVMALSASSIRQENFIETMKSGISQGLQAEPPQPVGISYCPEVLDNPSVRKMRPSGGFYRPTCDGDGDGKPDLHGSLIIGQRKKPDGSCEYLVRNSWGSSCNRYDLPSQCDNGHRWINSDALINNTADITFLEE